MAGRTFAIGDIHGCNKTFDALLFDVLKIDSGDTIYLLGDYIDRGNNPKAVVDRILWLESEGYAIYPIIGNHEQLLLDSFFSDENHLIWIYNGAKDTLKSFGVSFARELETKYITFFRNLKYYYIFNNYILVHGGINFDIANPLSDTYSMVWLRNKVVYPEKIEGRKLIVGHTPTSPEAILNSLNTNKIMLDSGCVYYGKYQSMGYLSALELNTMELYQQINIE